MERTLVRGKVKVSRQRPQEEASVEAIKAGVVKTSGRAREGGGSEGQRVARSQAARLRGGSEMASSW